MWGFRTTTNDVGGVYIDAAGHAYRMFSSATGGWLAPEVIRVAGSATPLANVVPSSSCDGTYLLLRSLTATMGPWLVCWWSTTHPPVTPRR